jgi:hypothetical protein
MGSHADSCQALLLREVDFVGQSCNLGEFEWGGFFAPSSLKLGVSTYKRREARLMVLAIKPCHMPSPKRGLHGKVKAADTRAGLETHAPNNLTVSGTQLVFQEKVILEQRKVRRNSKECFTKMDEDDDLKNKIRIKMD